MPKLPDINRIVNQNGIDIISINETHLDDTINDFELLIPGFLLYRRDRNRHGGGVAFYIKKSIPHKLWADLSMPGLESIWVEVNAPGGLSYLLCSMYRPPSASHDYYDKIVENIELASMLNKEIVIFGDLNFNYIIDESLSSNPIHLIETLFQMSQMISEPTRRTLTSSTLLDVMLTSIPEKHSESRVLKTAFSDRYSLFTVIDATKSLSNNGGHKLIKFRDYKNFDENEFLDDITGSECLENILSETDVVRGWQSWKTKFLKHCTNMPQLLREGSNLETTHGWLQILSNQCIDVISSIKKLSRLMTHLHGNNTNVCRTLLTLRLIQRNETTMKT